MAVDETKLIVGLEAALATEVAANGAWIYVSVDRESGTPINAAGFWAAEIDAALAAMTDPDVDSAHLAIPLFIQNPPPW